MSDRDDGWDAAEAADLRSDYIDDLRDEIAAYKRRFELLKVKLSMSKVSRQFTPYHEWADEVLRFLDDPNPDQTPFSGFVHKGDKDEE